MAILTNGMTSRTYGLGLGMAVALAASLLLLAAPGVSAAGDHGDHGDHGGFHGNGGRGAAHWGGGHGEGGGHIARGGPREGGHFERGGPREGHFGGRGHYAVPPHWTGMHPHWEGGGRWGDWDGDRHWVRPWGPRWEPHYWGGGYWRGRFWPHIYLGWDFPWFMAALPLGYGTYWWGGVPYYYWQGVYYTWSPDYDGYVVTDPPPVTGGPAPGASAPPAQSPAGDGRGAMSLYVYPKNGQSEQQTQSDRYQCHEWAVGQTGFDPTNSASDTQASTATPESYKRAVTACLEARGYSVR
jgi:hypothetical protein